MKRCAPIIAQYEDIVRLTGEMAAAARGADWDRLVALESDCRERVARLKAPGEAPPLSEHEIAHKAELLRAILANDAEIREHLQPWLAKLGQFLGAPQRTAQLRAAYRNER